MPIWVAALGLGMFIAGYQIGFHLGFKLGDSGSPSWQEIANRWKFVAMEFQKLLFEQEKREKERT